MQWTSGRCVLFLTSLFILFVRFSSLQAQPCEDADKFPYVAGQWVLPSFYAGMAVTPDGYVFVSDFNGHQVCRYSLTGDNMMCFGSEGLGAGEFREPMWVKYNPVNNLIYVTGQNDYKIQAFTTGGSLVYEWGDVPFTTDPGDFASHTGPIGIDPDGNVWVYDAGEHDGVTVDRIQKFSPTGAFLGVTINNGPSSEPPQCGFWVVLEDIVFNDAGEMFVLDRGYGDGTTGQEWPRVHRLDQTGACIDMWGEFHGENGYRDGQLEFPFQMAFDRDGYLNIACLDSVYKFTPDGNFLDKMFIGTQATGGIAFAPGETNYMVCSSRQAITQAPAILALNDPPKPLKLLATNWVNDQYEITTDYNELATCDDPLHPEVLGVGADGVAPLMLRWRVPGPGTVRFSMEDSEEAGRTDGLGTISEINGAPDPVEVTVSTQQVGSEHIAFAVYTAPLDFDRDVNDNPKAFRFVKVMCEWVPAGSAANIDISRLIVIQRPPVVFIHGLWSKKQAWNQFQSIIGDSRFPFYKVDYSSTHGQSLDVNTQRVRQGILGARTAAANAKISAAQVDVIAHSMGGVLTRKYYEETGPVPFRRRDNMGQGDLHKVLFLNVPHEGAPTADIVRKLRETRDSAWSFPSSASTAEFLIELAAVIFGTTEAQIAGGAVDDLGQGAVSLSQFDIPSHAHVGTGGSDYYYGGGVWDNFFLANLVVMPTAAFLMHASEFTTLPEVADILGNVNDTAVLYGSQMGGMTDSEHHDVVGYRDGIHTEAMKSDDAGELALEFALAPVGSDFFMQSVPATIGGAPSPPAPLPDPGIVVAAASPDEIPSYRGQVLSITSPADGAIFAPGQNVSVSLSSSHIFDPSTAMVTISGGSKLLEGTMSTSFQVPWNSAGPIEIAAIGKFGDGTIGSAATITINAVPTDVLEGIVAGPNPMILDAPGAMEQVEVVGSYDSGRYRSLTSSSLGTVYSGFDPAIIDVDAEGVVRALAAGETVIQVDNGAFTATFDVIVNNNPAVDTPPNADAGGPYATCTGLEVTLDASGSSDNQVGGLTFEWDIDLDGTWDVSGVSPTVTVAIDDVATLVALRVTDSGGLTSISYAMVHAAPGCLDGDFVCADPLPNQLDRIDQDDAGYVYVLETNFYGNDHVIHKYDSNCNLLNSFNMPTQPGVIGVGPDGKIYTADGWNDDIEVFANDGTPLPVISTTPYNPDAVAAVDALGNIYAKEYDGPTYLRKFAPDGSLLASWDLSTVSVGSFDKLAVAPDGSVYLAGGYEIVKGTPQGSGYTLSARWGQQGSDPGEFDYASGVAVGPDGDVYVSDNRNHRIQRFTSDGVFKSLRLSSGGPNGEIFTPNGIAIGSSGTVFTLDTDVDASERMQVFNYTSGIATPVVVSNVQAYPDSLPGTSQYFDYQYKLIVTWDTNVPATSRVEYRADDPSSPLPWQTTAEHSALKTSHYMRIDVSQDEPPGTFNNFEVRAISTTSTSSDVSVAVAATTELATAEIAFGSITGDVSNQKPRFRFDFTTSEDTYVEINIREYDTLPSIPWGAPEVVTTTPASSHSIHLTSMMVDGSPEALEFSTRYSYFIRVSPTLPMGAEDTVYPEGCSQQDETVYFKSKVTPAQPTGGGKYKPYEPPIEQLDGPVVANYLAQNYPNPFNPDTVVQYGLLERTSVRLRIYDVAGRLVRELENGSKEAGHHLVKWNGADGSGVSVASGVYFLKLELDTETFVRRMVLLK